LVVTTMNWTIVAFGSSFLLLVAGCSQGDRVPAEPVDCTVADAYEFLNISNFDTTESGWFRYADPTPGGAPNTTMYPECSNVPVTLLEAPGRCDDTRILKLEMEGKNFWGSGFGDWQHNASGSRADGTGYEGISFWARSPVNAEKQFFLNVDDSRTIILPPEPAASPSDAGVPENTCPPPQADVLPEATSADQDLDGDGFVGPGDIARDTQCRLPPPSELGEATCYNGGVDGPASAGMRVPAPDECGNAFHTRITTTETWQLFLIPWNELVQWPCPNRLDGGINRADIAKFEIKLDQGMAYELWIDNIAFYRQRRD
jgi:hypothetical protein